MIKIIKFKGRNRNPNKVKSHVAVVTVVKDGITKEVDLPVIGTPGTISSLGRKWKNIPGNMDRLEQAFDTGLDAVPSNRTK